MDANYLQSSPSAHDPAENFENTSDIYNGDPGYPHVWGGHRMLTVKNTFYDGYKSDEVEIGHNSMQRRAESCPILPGDRETKAFRGQSSTPVTYESLTTEEIAPAIGIEEVQNANAEEDPDAGTQGNPRTVESGKKTYFCPHGLAICRNKQDCEDKDKGCLFCHDCKRPGKRNRARIANRKALPPPKDQKVR